MARCQPFSWFFALQSSPLLLRTFSTPVLELRIIQTQRLLELLGVLQERVRISNEFGELIIGQVF